MQPTANRVLNRVGLAACALAGASLVFSCASSSPHSRKVREDAKERFNSNSAQLAAQQAEQAFRVSDLKAARGNIEVALQRDPDNAEYCVLKGQILTEMNNLEGAMDAFTQAIEIDPKNSAAHYYQGLVYQRWSDDVRAADAYKVAFDLVPSDLYYFCAYVETLFALRRFDEAHEVINRTGVYFSHNASARRLRGHLALLEGDAEEAAEHFYQAILVAPDDTALVENLVIALYQSRQYARCRHYLEQLAAREEFANRIDLLHMRALCLVATDNLVDARFAYVDLVKRDPSSPVLWNELGVLAYRLGDWRRVEESARTQISNWPDRYEGYLLRGLLNEHMGKLEPAAADYQRAAQLAPDPTHATLLLGLTYRRLNRPREAEAAFEAARMARPNDAELQTLLAGFTDSGDTVGRW